MTDRPSNRSSGEDAELVPDSEGRRDVGEALENAVLVAFLALALGVGGSMAVADVEWLGWTLLETRLMGVQHWPWNATGALLGLFVGFEVVTLRYLRLR